jgi:6-pyruvoyltetrahydropterin/6-carboxytetrahydropterin synthase
MPIAYLTRVVQFSAAHRYHRPEWSAEQNARVFGTCAREHGHGHTYRCAVTVKGPPDTATGMVADLAALDRILQEEIVARYDHRHLNLDLPEFAYGRTVPTGEMLCMDVWRRIAPRLPDGCTLHAVRVQEDPALWAEFLGEA